MLETRLVRPLVIFGLLLIPIGVSAQLKIPPNGPFVIVDPPAEAFNPSPMPLLPPGYFVLCLTAEDFSDTCVTDDIKSGKDRLARFVLEKIATGSFKHQFSMRYSFRQDDQAKQDIASIQETITALVAARRQTAQGKLNHFSQENADEYIMQLETHAKKERQDASNYSSKPLTNTVVFQLSSEYYHAVACAGAAQRLACNWHEVKGQPPIQKDNR